VTIGVRDEYSTSAQASTPSGSSIVARFIGSAAFVLSLLTVCNPLCPVPTSGVKSEQNPPIYCYKILLINELYTPCIGTNPPYTHGSQAAGGFRLS
jgi:hypothetical protein